MKKEYTEFGKYFTSLRKKRKQSISEAAELLGVSTSYISSVEHGDREIPSNWRKKIMEIYNLDEEEVKKLNESYYATPSLRKISLLEVEAAITNMINNLFEGEEKEKALKKVDEMIKELRN